MTLAGQREALLNVDVLHGKVELTSLRSAPSLIHFRVGPLCGKGSVVRSYVAGVRVFAPYSPSWPVGRQVSCFRGIKSLRVS